MVRSMIFQLTLPLDRWSLEPEVVPEEDESGAKAATRPDLKFFSTNPNRFVDSCMMIGCILCVFRRVVLHDE